MVSWCLRKMNQTAAARPESVLTVLKSLHRLPACQRIEFISLLLVYKTLIVLDLNTVLTSWYVTNPPHRSGAGVVIAPVVQNKHSEAVSVSVSPALEQVYQNCQCI